MNISVPHANSHRHLNTRRHTVKDESSKKLLAIAGMMLVIGYLVWMMG